MDFDYALDAITPTQSPNLTINSTGALVLPSGTTAQRPTPVNGTLRYNSDTQSLDLVVGGAYQSIRGAVNLATTGITAAGTTQATATIISAGVNNVTTVASGSGVVFPTLVAGDRYAVVNKGVNSLLVYPPTGCTIGMLAVNTGYSVSVNKTVLFATTTSTQLEIVSDTALYGSSSQPTTITISTTPYNVAILSGTVIYLINAASAPIVVNIPAASTSTALYTFKKVDATANIVTLTPTTSTIEGAATAVLTVAGLSVDVVNDSSNYFIT